jgi:hypothetical protein
MEEMLRSLCEAHDLTTISVMFQSRHNNFTVYPHWEFEGEDHCASGSHNTLDGAFAAAIQDAKRERENQASNAAEAAWERQQQSLMESGGPDDSAYRRDMINAGRGHLLR